MNTPHYKRVLASAAVLGVAVLGPLAAPAQAAPGGNSGPAKQGQAKSGHASNGKAKGHSSSHRGGGNGAAHANGHANGHAGGGSRGHSGQPQGQANGHSHAGGSAPASPGSGNGPKAGHGGQSGQGGNGSDPAGNNGTVKIETSPPGKDVPNNVPHVGCTFRVEWYGFDEGDDIISTVDFAMHSPTADVDLSGDRPRKVFVGGDPATGAGTATGLDGKKVYTLAFDGEPHAQQGYHVKLTIHTPGSIGADTKHKVFWVQPCEQPPGGRTPPTVQGKQKTAKDHKVQVAGKQQVAPTSVNAAEVPTAVAAGVAPTDAVPVTSPLPGLVATLGGLLAALGFRRKRAA